MYSKDQRSCSLFERSKCNAFPNVAKKSSLNYDIICSSKLTSLWLDLMLERSLQSDANSAIKRPQRPFSFIIVSLVSRHSVYPAIQYPCSAHMSTRQSHSSIPPKRPRQHLKTRHRHPSIDIRPIPLQLSLPLIPSPLATPVLRRTTIYTCFGSCLGGFGSWSVGGICGRGFEAGFFKARREYRCAFADFVDFEVYEEEGADGEEGEAGVGVVDAG